MRIVHDFHQQVRRVAPRKRKSEITRYDRQRLRHIIGWLEFCGRKYRLERITQLRQDHYTAYMRELNRRGLSGTTIYNHALSLQKFIERAHLDIKVNPGRAFKRRQERLLQEQAPSPGFTPGGEASRFPTGIFHLEEVL